MSFIEYNDAFLIQRGDSHYQLAASEMSMLLPDDWLLVARGSAHYKVSGADVINQLGGGGGGDGRAAFEILEGPGVGTTIDLLDFVAYPDQTFTFTPGGTYRLKSLDTYLCSWDICGEGTNGGAGKNSNKNKGDHYKLPNIPGTDTLMTGDTFTLKAGSGTGGGGGKGTIGSPGIGGIAEVTGVVPGMSDEMTAEITLQNGYYGAAAPTKSSTVYGGNASSPLPTVGIFSSSQGSALGAPGQDGDDRNQAGGGGGAGGGAFVRLNLMRMVAGAEYTLSLGPKNSAAGIRYMRPFSAAVLYSLLRRYERGTWRKS